nr:MAG TPA: hypothetical protein [Bacteriophage sp.]
MQKKCPRTNNRPGIHFLLCNHCMKESPYEIDLFRRCLF